MAKNWYMREHARKTNAADKADYIQRQGRYKTKEGEQYLGGGNINMPKWSPDGREFWKTADRMESNKYNEQLKKLSQEIKDPAEREKKRKELERKALTVAREYEIMLPNNLTPAEAAELTETLARKLFPCHAVTWGAHCNTSSLSGRPNNHAHLMVCEREIDPNRPDLGPEEYFKKTRTRKDGTISGGYRKDPRMREIGHVEAVKAQAKEIINEYLRTHGKALQIDFRPLPSREKSHHLGAKAIARAAKGKPTKKVQKYLDQQVASARRAETKEEWNIADRYAAAPTVWDRVKSATRTAAAYISHPRDQEARENALEEARHAAINDRIKHTRVKRKNLFTPGKPYYPGLKVLTYKDGDEYVPVTTREGYPITKAAMIAIATGDPGGLTLLPDKQKAVTINPYRHDLEKARRNVDKLATNLAASLNSNLNAYAKRESIKQDRPAALSVAPRPGTSRTRKYWDDINKQKAEAEAAEKKAAQEIKEAEDIAEKARQDEKRQQEEAQEIAHTRFRERIKEEAKAKLKAKTKATEKQKQKQNTQNQNRGIHRSRTPDDNRGMHP